MNKIIKTVFLLLLVSNGKIFALTSPLDIILPSKEQWQGSREVFAHPYASDVWLDRFSLYRHGLVDLEIYGKLLLRNTSLANGIEIVASKREQSVDYSFRFLGIDICDLSVSVHRLSPRSLYYVGSYPSVAHLQITGWHEMEEARQQVLAILPDARFTRTSRCLLPSGVGFVPVYDFSVSSDGLPYKVRVDADAVLSVQRSFFAAQTRGKFRVYPENKKATPKKKEFYIDVDNGYLRNNFFQIVLDDEEIEAVHSEDNRFGFGETSETEMAQINAYAHVNLMWRWFVRMGFSPAAGEQLDIVLYPSFDTYQDEFTNDVVNNAYYFSGAPKNKINAKIVLGSGDGVRASGLHHDFDVVAHELGHHIIYQRLTSINGESSVVHEGLSDYFVYAYTGNACLAESICTNTDSDICLQRGKCLRHAKNNLTYLDVRRGTTPHIKGQVLSSFLWDLRESGDIAKADFDKIVFKSVDYLMWNSGLKGFIESMLASDYKFFAGENCKAILRAVRERGFDWFALNLKCRDLSSLHDERNVPASEGERKEALAYHDAFSNTISSDMVDSSYFTCAVILPSSSNTNYVLMFLAFVPMLLCLRLRKKSG